MHIHRLPQNIADQIAAGEVVERPSSVVKELVENAIDAGAKHIEIRIEEGGKKLIEIKDDGEGMERADAELSVERHATSKIKILDDLFSIQSFGFRGEALAAISAVSRFTLVTKRKDDSEGTKISLQAGECKLVEPVAANTGTLIRVEDLFYALPARAQHLKNEATEYRMILREIFSFALCFPAVSFQVWKDGKQTLDFPAVNEASVRLERILPPLKEKTEVGSKNASMKLNGFVSLAGQGVPTRSHQFLFVNNRRIEDYRLATAIREAYHQTAGIEKHLFPAFALFLRVEPLLVDVNAHPRKTEVRFAEPQEVFVFLRNAIMSALTNDRTNSFSHTPFPFSQVPTAPQGPWNPRATSKFPSNNSSPFSFPSRAPFSQRTFEPSVSSFSLPDAPIANGELSLIGQIANKYIAAESKTGLYLFDQHALHERERFEIFWKKYQADPSVGAQQALLIPQRITVREEDEILLMQKKQQISDSGFSLSFPEDTVVEVTAVPAILGGEDLTSMILDLVSYFENETLKENGRDAVMRKLLEYKSCRGAVMFGDALKREEMERLLEDFSQCQYPDLCPHGRPNHMFFPFEEMDGWFHR